MSKKDKNTAPAKIIAQNKKARFDYQVEQQFEAGLVLEGWEVKSLRAGRAQLKESYVILQKGAAWLVGCHISPLMTASTHIEPEPVRSRKLLLHQRELNQLIGAVERQGYTLVPLDLHWHKGRAKLEFGLAKGKKAHDKRASEKRKDWERDKQRLMRSA